MAIVPVDYFSLERTWMDRLSLPPGLLYAFLVVAIALPWVLPIATVYWYRDPSKRHLKLARRLEGDILHDVWQDELARAKTLRTQCQVLSLVLALLLSLGLAWGLIPLLLFHRSDLISSAEFTASAMMALSILTTVRFVGRAARDDLTAPLLAKLTTISLLTLAAVVVVGPLLKSIGTWRGQAPTVTVVLLGMLVGSTGGYALTALTNVLGVLEKRSDPVEDVEELLVINGLTNDDIERLRELGISTLRALALAPPFRLMLSLPHGTAHMLDWQCQALMWSRVPSSHWEHLRKSGIQRLEDIDALHESPDVFASLQELQIPPEELISLAARIRKEPQYSHLDGLRNLTTQETVPPPP